MPPIRRRPVPTPPAGGRPKVAGLHRRADVPGEESTEVTQAFVEDVAAEESTAETTPETKAAATNAPSTKAQKKAPKKAEAEVAEPLDAPKPWQPSWVLAGALLVVALLLGGLGFWFQQQAGKTSFDAALVDANATSEVNGQVREGVEKAFSYNFADVAATEKAANELLTGKAKCQYNAVFGPVKTLAPEQKLVVTVKVVASAVSSLKDDHATVLVFVDQVTTRTTDNQTGGGTAMLRAGAQKADGRWKIDNMEMFGQTAEQAEQMKQCR
ncbi:hypothetical protein Lesp02_27330 [Lentzea sp. NBRC 105346]|uniref:hypothetical protein n=1 Tax=Lentzea sp. NBRC 105346 TaxID=3032205 RepID=UPI00255610B5|nr:hypothetical protein [Lentzea sp. NBRC 105346]GLZ30544.1 hypothetical protein Lesp02_27330 [Lentzea sp. NBRC 105346]